MSIDNDLWHALYNDAVKDVATQRILTHEQTLRVIKLEGHRRTLIAHLKWAARELIGNNVGTGKQYLKVAQELEADYVEEAKVIRAQGTPAGDSTSDHGSSGPAGSTQAEAPAGTAQSTHGLPYIDLPVAVRQQQWDSIAPATGDLT